MAERVALLLIFGIVRLASRIVNMWNGTVDLRACQSHRILIDEDAVRNRVSMWVGDGLGKVCT